MTPTPREQRTPRPDGPSTSLQVHAKGMRTRAEVALGQTVRDEEFTKFVSDFAQTTGWKSDDEEHKMKFDKQWLEFLKGKGFEKEHWIEKYLKDLEVHKGRTAEIRARGPAVEEEAKLVQFENESKAYIDQQRRELLLRRDLGNAGLRNALEEEKLAVLAEQEKEDMKLELEHLVQRKTLARETAKVKNDMLKAKLIDFEREVVTAAAAKFSSFNGLPERSTEGGGVTVGLVASLSKPFVGADAAPVRQMKDWNPPTAQGLVSGLSAEMNKLKEFRVEHMLQEMEGDAKTACADSILSTAQKRLEEMEKRSQAKAKRREVDLKEKEDAIKDNEFLKERFEAEETAELERKSMVAQAKINAHVKENKTKLVWNACLLEQHAETSKELANQVPIIEKALQITEEFMTKAKVEKKTVQCARIMWLMVIIGCELDLYGFVLAFSDYWACGLVLMRAMLILGPFGYFIAMMMYTQGVDDVDSSHLGMRERLIDLESQQKVRIRDPRLVRKTGQKDESAHVQYDMMVLEAPREQVHLQYYHFLPIVRYYLLVKDPQVNDVECLFRVNALSTFSLGFAQISCMLLGICSETLPWPIDIKIKIGIFAQFVNGTITFLYFFSEYPAKMKSQMQVEALQSITAKSMQEEFVRYALTAEQCSVRLDSAFPRGSDFDALPEADKQLIRDVDVCRCKVIRDINQYANCSLEEPLKQFSTTQLFEWRSKLATRNIAAYGKLVSV